MPNEASLLLEPDHRSGLIYGNAALVGVENANAPRLNVGTFVLPSSGSPLSLIYDENVPESPALATTASYEIDDLSRFTYLPSTFDVVIADYMKSFVSGLFVANPLTDLGSFEKLPSGSPRGVAFSNVDEIRGRAGPRILSHLIGYLRAFFKPEYGRQLANRVEELSHLLRDDYEGRVEISAMSLYYLIAFLEAHSEIRRPSVSVTPHGLLIAQWRDAEGQRLSVHFSAEGSARAFLLIRNDNHPEQIDRSDVCSTADSIYERTGLSNVRWLRA